MKECPACNQDPCVCDDSCDSCGAQVKFMIKEQIIEQLKTVYDPEITSINIFDLGLIYDIDVKDKDVTVTHTLTSMFCPMADEISENIKKAIIKVEGIGKVKVKLTHTPPFTKEMMSDDARLSLGL